MADSDLSITSTDLNFELQEIADAEAAAAAIPEPVVSIVNIAVPVPEATIPNVNITEPIQETDVIQQVDMDDNTTIGSIPQPPHGGISALRAINLISDMLPEEHHNVTTQEDHFNNQDGKLL